MKEGYLSRETGILTGISTGQPAPVIFLLSPLSRSVRSSSLQILTSIQESAQFGEIARSFPHSRFDLSGRLSYRALLLLQVLTSVEEGDLFGEIGVLCNMPQPFMCRASQLTKVLRIDRNDFSDVVQSYVKDGSQVVTNLLEVRLGFLVKQWAVEPDSSEMIRKLSNLTLLMGGRS